MAQLDSHLLLEESPGVLRFAGARMALFDVFDGFWGLRRYVEGLVGRRLADAVLRQAGANGGESFARSLCGTTPAVDGARALRDCLAAFQAAGFGRFELAGGTCQHPCCGHAGELDDPPSRSEV